MCQRVQLVCYRDQSAHEEKAFFESLQMSFDKIKSCGQIFSAIVLLGDFNAHFNRPINYGDTSSPNADIGIRVFIFVATTRSSSRALCWHFVRENVSSPNLRTVLGILTDTADTDACCCYRRLSWWVNRKCPSRRTFFPLGTNQKCRDTNDFNTDSLMETKKNVFRNLCLSQSGVIVDANGERSAATVLRTLSKYHRL